MNKILEYWKNRTDNKYMKCLLLFCSSDKSNRIYNKAIKYKFQGISIISIDCANKFKKTNFLRKQGIHEIIKRIVQWID